MAVRTSAIDVVVRMRGQRNFAAQTRATAAELEALGLKGSKALGSVAIAGQKLQNFGSKMSKAITLPVVGAGIVMGKFAVDFDESMRNVNSIAQLPEKQLQALEGQVLDLAGPTAQAPKTLADSLYDLVSSGFDAKQSMTILKSSAKAATAGLTEAAVSTKTVAAVLNAYHLPASKAKDVSDVLFRTVDRGVISFEELSGSIGDVLPFAASLGVPLRDVGASIATMTKAGINPSETMTRIKNVMTSLLKPSEDLKNTFKDLGFESGEAMIKQLGFQGALDKLAKSTGGSKEEMAKLFPNIRSLGGALALTGDNAAGAHEDLKMMADSAGATNRALGQQKQSVAYKMRQLSAELQALAIKTAPPLISAFQKLIGAVASVGHWFSKLPAPVREFAVNALLLLAAVGPLTWALGALLKGPFALIAASKGVIVFFQGLTATMEALNVGALTATSSMLGLDIAMLASIAAPLAVAAAIGILYWRVKGFRDFVNKVGVWLKDHWKLIFAIPGVNIAVGALYVVVKAVQAIIDHFGTLKKIAATVWTLSPLRLMIKLVGFLISKIQSLIDKILGPLKDALGVIKDAADAVAGAAGKTEFQSVHPEFFRAPRGPGGPVGGDRRHRLPRRAMGGPVLPGGTALVGERGPELASFPFGAHITDTQKTAGLLAARGQDLPPITIPLYLDGKIIAESTVRAGETAKARK